MKEVVKFLVTLFENTENIGIQILKIEKNETDKISITYSSDNNIFMVNINSKNATYEDMNNQFYNCFLDSEKYF